MCRGAGTKEWDPNSGPTPPLYKRARLASSGRYSNSARKQTFSNNHSSSGRRSVKMRGLKLLILVLFGVTLILSIRIMVTGQSSTDPAASQAPAGFDNLTNGFLTQVEFNKAKASFEE